MKVSSFSFSVSNSNRPVLTLAEIEAYDPNAPAAIPTSRGMQRHFYCPLCGDNSDRNGPHPWWRCLRVNLDNGGWTCIRCKTQGFIKEKWNHLPPRERARAQLRRITELPPRNEGPDPETLEKFLAHLAREKPIPLENTPGAEYIAGRGIPPDIAARAGVEFARSWFGRPAVMFPMHGEDGALLAYNGRYIDNLPHTEKTPKTRAHGPRGKAVFAWPGALEADPVVIVEGPMCVLTLALLGIPALAPVAITCPRWVMRRLAFRQVFVAFDSDPVSNAGDTAAEKRIAELTEYGATASRLTPPPAAGADKKSDWNDILRYRGIDALRAALEPVFLAQAKRKPDPEEPQVKHAWTSDRAPVSLAQAPPITVIESDILGERIILLQNETDPDPIPPDLAHLVTYTPREIALLKDADTDTLQKLHMIKKQFRGSCITEKQTAEYKQLSLKGSTCHAETA